MKRIFLFHGVSDTWGLFIIFQYCVCACLRGGQHCENALGFPIAFVGFKLDCVASVFSLVYFTTEPKISKLVTYLKGGDRWSYTKYLPWANLQVVRSTQRPLEISWGFEHVTHHQSAQPLVPKTLSFAYPGLVGRGQYLFESSHRCVEVQDEEHLHQGGKRKDHEEVQNK